jgi:hypothetical protein
MPMFSFSAPDADPETEETTKNPPNSNEKDQSEVFQTPKDQSQSLEDKSLEYDGELQSLLGKGNNIELLFCIFLSKVFCSFIIITKFNTQK